jgi:hypothetical protein
MSFGMQNQAYPRFTKLVDNLFIQGGATAQGIKLTGIEPSSGRPGGGVELRRLYPSAASSGSFDPLVSDWGNYRLIDSAYEIDQGVSGTVPTGDSRIIGGVAFGNEALEDYDEGSWTPVLTGASGGSYTYDAQNGRYTRIGNLMFVSGYLDIATTSVSPTGSLLISGLPTASSSINMGNVINFSGVSNMATSTGPIVGRIGVSSTTFDLMESDGVGTSTPLVAADIQGTDPNATILRFSGFYVID